MCYIVYTCIYLYRHIRQVGRVRVDDPPYRARPNDTRATAAHG